MTLDGPIRANRFADSRESSDSETRESLNGGFSNGGLRCLSAIEHDFLQLSSFCDEKSLYKRPRMCTIADDCAQIAESGLKPPFESPHLDFPNSRKSPEGSRIEPPYFANRVSGR